mmetsp:Transcript_1082/g.2307  ORF Transcript_1082/g.2307 Transcript_1082/m.2307 type:complete len:433 (+) Transcript_1082:789-2087(+)
MPAAPGPAQAQRAAPGSRRGRPLLPPRLPRLDARGHPELLGGGHGRRRRVKAVPAEGERDRPRRRPPQRRHALPPDGIGALALPGSQSHAPLGGARLRPARRLAQLLLRQRVRARHGGGTGRDLGRGPRPGEEGLAAGLELVQGAPPAQAHRALPRPQVENGVGPPPHRRRRQVHFRVRRSSGNRLAQRSGGGDGEPVVALGVPQPAANVQGHHQKAGEHAQGAPQRHAHAPNGERQARSFDRGHQRRRGGGRPGRRRVRRRKPGQVLRKLVLRFRRGQLVHAAAAAAGRRQITQGAGQVQKGGQGDRECEAARQIPFGLEPQEPGTKVLERKPGPPVPLAQGLGFVESAVAPLAAAGEPRQGVGGGGPDAGRLRRGGAAQRPGVAGEQADGKPGRGERPKPGRLEGQVAVGRRPKQSEETPPSLRVLNRCI